MFNDGLKSSKQDSWTTPRDTFDSLDREFHFVLDAAALQASTLVPSNWYGPDHPESSRQDALTRNWYDDSNGGTVWLNPPYGRAIKSFMAKADAESKAGATVICLVPSRTDTQWWWDSVIHHETRFIKGRLKFGNQKNSAPFPSAVVIMKPKV